MNLIFDTDVLIDLLRGKDETARQVEKLTEEADELGCSVITVGEIFSGMKGNEEKGTKELLNDLLKETVTEEVAELAGHLKGKTKSHQLALDDCLIAATALLKGATLVTKNIKHYPFENLKRVAIR
jgi:predicted nucleic acid-binding protein